MSFTDGKRWLVVDLPVQEQQIDLVSWLLIHELNGTTCQLGRDRQPESFLRVGFELEESGCEQKKRLRAALSRHGLSALEERLTVQEISGREFLEHWSSGLKPMAMGGRFLTSPPWSLEKSERPEILVSPRQSFGSGYHASTHLCLCALESYGHGPRILDLGAGSGILSIAAALLFENCKVMAVEVERDSVEIAFENFVVNNVHKRIKLVEGDWSSVPVDERFDTIIANINCKVNCDLLGQFACRLTDRGVLMMAGFLSKEAPQIETEARRCGARVVDLFCMDGWGCLVVPAFMGS